MITKGNAKLGRKVWAVSLEAGASCPGASEWCKAHCYAATIQTRRPNVRSAWGRNLSLLREDPGAYEAIIRMDLAKLQAGSVVRIHVSGDFESTEHVALWHRVVRDFPSLTFYAYSRSWTVPTLRDALEGLATEPNVSLWASTDETMPAVPEGWREAHIFDTEDQARSAGFPVCPEQVGRKASCSDCGLCWKAKPAARLAFVSHANLGSMTERHAMAEGKVQ